MSEAVRFYLIIALVSVGYFTLGYYFGLIREHRRYMASLDRLQSNLADIEAERQRCRKLSEQHQNTAWEYHSRN